MPRGAPLGLPVVFEDSADPTSTSDRSTIGARMGNLWRNARRWFLCRDPASSAAVWQRIDNDCFSAVPDGNSNLSVTAAHGDALIVVTSGTRTHSLPACSGLFEGWRVRWKNRSGNTLTVNTAGETVNGSGTSFTVANGASITATVRADGTWETT